MRSRKGVDERRRIRRLESRRTIRYASSYVGVGKEEVSIGKKQDIAEIYEAWGIWTLPAKKKDSDKGS